MIATIDEAGCIRIAEQIGEEQKALEGLKKERAAILCFIHAELKHPDDEIKAATVLYYAQELQKNSYEIDKQKAVIKAKQGIVNGFGVIFG
jgi:tRNA U34 5-carboxymethylaminomethyl modifying GTPase MnmE/TrmE